MQFTLLFISIIISIVFISKGSDWLTDSLVPVARRLKTSTISVGLILVSVFVSLPEILVATYTAFSGYKDISLGVAFGSIICNIALMTGISALVRPLKVTSNMILRDGIFSIITPILIFAIGYDGVITRIDGLAIFLLFIPYLTNVFLQEKNIKKEELKREIKEVAIEFQLFGFDFGKITAGWLSFFLGLIFLLGGTYLFSEILIQIVEMFNIAPLYIGLTLGALVPSVPNIAAAYKATRKGLTEVAVSETLGSNIFTLLVTIGILSMLSPVTIKRHWVIFDIPIMMVMSFLLFFFTITETTISKKEGAILVGSYIVFLIIQTILFIR